MARALIANNAVSTLSASITGASTSITVQSGEGARFPSPGADQFFFLTIQEGSAFEIVKCTTRTVDTLTITRAQEGTLAQSFADDSSVTMRITAGVFESLQDEIDAVDAVADAATVSAAAAAASAAAANTAAAAASTSRLPLAGGTMTGALTISFTDPHINLRKQTIAENPRIYGYAGVLVRWSINLANGVAETGSNAGSNFTIDRWSDAGAYLDSPFAIIRSTGQVVVAGGGIASTGAITSQSAIQSRNGVLGTVAMSPGASGNPGFVEFRTPDLIRRGYIGWSSGASELILQSENTWGWRVSGTMKFDNVPYFDGGSILVRSNTAPAVVFRTLGDSYLSQIYHDISTGDLVLQSGAGAPAKITANNTLYAPARDSNPNSGNFDSSLEVNAGVGGTFAAMAFHVPTLYATKLGLRTDGYMLLGGGSANDSRWFVDMNNGNMTAAGAVTAFSDERLKDDVRPIQDPLRILKELDGVKFTWNGRSKLSATPGRRGIGVLAQQVEKVLPELVHESPWDGDTRERYKMVDYAGLTPVLVEAVKTLLDRVMILEARVVELENL